MDPKLKAAYERIYARELKARERLFNEYPSYVATWVPGRTGKAVRATTVRSWWRCESVFAFRHAGHFYFPAFQFINGAPKPLVSRLLTLVRPTSGWHAMFWFVGANTWLEDASPVDVFDDEPDAAIEAAAHANDEISD